MFPPYVVGTVTGAGRYVSKVVQQKLNSSRSGVTRELRNNALTYSSSINAHRPAFVYSRLLFIQCTSDKRNGESGWFLPKRLVSNIGVGNNFPAMAVRIMEVEASPLMEVVDLAIVLGSRAASVGNTFSLHPF